VTTSAPGVVSGALLNFKKDNVMSEFELEDAIKHLKAVKNIAPEKTYTVTTNHPNQGDELSSTGAQLIELSNAYLALFEAEKSGDKKKLAEATMKIMNL